MQKCLANAGQQTVRFSPFLRINMKSTETKPRQTQARLRAIVCLLAANSSCAVISAANHHYPLGMAMVLFLLPGLSRELDLRRGYSLRPFGVFEWSCFAAGFALVVGLFLFGEK